MINKKALAIFLVAFTLCSCSGQSSRVVASENGDVSLEDDYNWVDGLNFDKKVETKYNPENDEFKNKKDDGTNVLIKESVSSLPPPRLEEQLLDNNDPLAKIIIKCTENKFEEAFVLIDQNYNQFKNNTSYWNQVGSCYYLKGDFSKAILFYNKSRDLDAKFAPPVNNIGVVYQKQGKFQKALSAYKKASDLSNFSVTPAFNLARLYLQFGIISKAEPILDGLYKKSTNDIQVVNALATLDLIKSDYENAINIFSTLPKDLLVKPEFGINYALALKLNNKLEDAKLVMSKMGESVGEMKIYANKVDTFIRN